MCFEPREGSLVADSLLPWRSSSAFVSCSRLFHWWTTSRFGGNLSASIASATRAEQSELARRSVPSPLPSPRKQRSAQAPVLTIQSSVSFVSVRKNTYCLAVGYSPFSYFKSQNERTSDDEKLVVSSFPCDESCHAVLCIISRRPNEE